MGRGEFWKDARRRAAATQKLRESWAARRFFIVSWDSGREVETTSLAEVSQLVCRSTPTLQVYLAHGKGQAQVEHDGELVTIRRVYR